MKNRIRTVRQSKDISQSALAALLKTTSASVSRYEREDRRVNLHLLIKIADALNCDPLELVTDQFAPESSSVTIPRFHGEPHLIFDKAEAEHLDLPATARALRIEDDAMAPALGRGDLCIADMSVSTFSGNGLYLIGADRPCVRRLSRNVVNGLIIVSTDNPTHPNDGDFPESDVAIAGRVAASIKKS